MAAPRKGRPTANQQPKPETAIPPGLATYARKRNFGVTSEPAPGPGRRAGDTSPPTFMVHKHDARRLHYDLRLEIDDALASWAVPRGPSFDPRVRRLAVQTEDHPLEYGGFEGRIPDGEYGAGDSLIWDRGTFETTPPGQASAMRKKGHVEFVLQGEKLKGRWHLIRTRGGRGKGEGDDGHGGKSEGPKSEWLLFKAKDEFASDTYDVVAERPESVVSGRQITRGPTPAAVRREAGDPLSIMIKLWPPAQPRAAKRAPDPGRYVFEGRGEGRRALAGVAGGRVALQSDEGRDLAAAHPTLVRALAALSVVETVLDGEIIEPDQPGGPRFLIHDVLWLDGQDRRARPFEERRELLRGILADRHVSAPAEGKAGAKFKSTHVAHSDELALAPLFEGSFDDARADATKVGLHHLAARKRASPYGDGATDWLLLDADVTPPAKSHAPAAPVKKPAKGSVQKTARTRTTARKRAKTA